MRKIKEAGPRTFNWCSKVKPLRLMIVSFWSVMELSFSLVCRNSEHQGCLSFNGLPTIVLNFFQMSLSLYLSVLPVYVDIYHVCGPCRYAKCMYHGCMPLVWCTLCVWCSCVYCIYSEFMCAMYVYILDVFSPCGDQKRIEVQPYSVWWLWHCVCG